MKKVLIFFGGSHFSEGAFEFARRLNELQPLLLVGAFIPQISYTGLWAPVPLTGYEFIPLVEEEINAMKAVVKRFEARCLENNITYHVHSTFIDFTLAELKIETRFADLLVISSDKFYENIIGEDPEAYLKDVLSTTECPVIVIPEAFDFPSNNVFAYNGSESSVFAIRQFIYLFPEFCKNESTFVYAGEDDDSTIPEEEDIREFAEPHLQNASFLKLGFNPKKYFSTWISEKKHSILVGGSHGRPGIRQLFKKTFFNDVIAEKLLPVFVAHK